MSVNIDQLSPAELKKLKADLFAKEESEARLKAKARKKYEDDRDKLVDKLGYAAKSLNNKLQKFKYVAESKLSDLRAEMIEYGDLRNGVHNKGSFVLKNEKFKIEVKTQVKKEFDERADLAAEHLKRFMDSLVKKNSKEVSAIISTALYRNEKTNKFDPDAIMRLYTLESEIADEDFQKALALFKESYSPTGTKLYIKFSQMDEAGAWESILLDFASLKHYTVEGEDES